MFQQENRSGWRQACSTLLACVVLTAPALRAQTPVGRPKIAEVSADLGAIQASAEMTLTVHLNVHDQQAFDQAVKGLYTSGSPTYHRWMTNNEIARYAPTSAEVETVTSALQSHGVSVLSIAPDHLSSLACPIFSAIWAIAAQAAGKPLGQAAPLVYTLPSPAIIDVVPVNSTTNVTGIMVDSSGENDYSPSALLAPLYTTTGYYSTLWNIGGGEFVDLSFGTDASLTVTPGWDNVTGLGVPNGLAFINAVVNAQ
jgi:subtilase family serine protease